MKKAILLATLLLPSCVGIPVERITTSNTFNPETSSPAPNASFCGGLIDSTVRPKELTEEEKRIEAKKRIEAERQAKAEKLAKEERLARKVLYNRNRGYAKFRDGGFGEQSWLDGTTMQASTLSSFYRGIFKRKVGDTKISLRAAPQWPDDIVIIYKTQANGWVNLGRNLELVTPDGTRYGAIGTSSEVLDRGGVWEWCCFSVPRSVVASGDFIFQIAGDARGPKFATYLMPTEALDGFSEAYEKQYGSPLR